MAKFIFLDIDGVLNYTSWYTDDRNPGNLYGQEADIDPLCIERINRICTETDCRIVISSDWRYDFAACCKRLYNAGLTGLIIGKTPEFIWRQRMDPDAPTRGSEIQEWLEQNSVDGDKYCIIDDRNDFLDSQFSYFVFVNPMYGLTDEHVNKIIKILNDD